MPTGDETPTLKQALSGYFADNGFAADGGYTDKWVVGMFGPVPFAFPNVEARRRAVRVHDLHHVLTGYATDGVGDGEIPAWELASGCTQYGAALYLNVLGMFVGWLLARDAIWRAFVRGRRSRNFYDRTYDEALLATPVATARATMLPDTTPAADAPATADERRAFALWLAAGAASVRAHLTLLAALVSGLLFAWWV